jgi:hypothetical protein
MLRCTNLSLLILYPIAWFAPLLNARLLPLFGLIAISEISGLQSLWETDVFLARLVTVFALLAPLRKDNQFGITSLEPAEPKAAAGTSHPWKTSDGRYLFNRVVCHPVQGTPDRTYRNCMGALFVHRVYHHVTSNVPVQ